MTKKNEQLLKKALKKANEAYPRNLFTYPKSEEEVKALMKEAYDLLHEAFVMWNNNPKNQKEIIDLIDEDTDENTKIGFDFAEAEDGHLCIVVFLKYSRERITWKPLLEDKFHDFFQSVLKEELEDPYVLEQLEGEESAVTWDVSESVKLFTPCIYNGTLIRGQEMQVSPDLTVLLGPIHYGCMPSKKDYKKKRDCSSCKVCFD